MRVMKRSLAAALGVVGCLTFAACGNLSEQPLPAGTSDPGSVANATGAREMAVNAHGMFQQGLVTYIIESGLLTDELSSNNRGAPVLPGTSLNGDVAVDSRQLGDDQTTNTSIGNVYVYLHQTRTGAQEAISALAMYAPDSSARLRGELYAWQGYAEVMLADIFCSGVPLSHIDYQHDFTYEPSSTTAEVYEHAITMFDSALTLASDSAPVANLARVGKGRALLALGRYADAGQAVADVPSDFVYADTILTCGVSGCPSANETIARLSLAASASVSDMEGLYGRPFISSHDPRTAVLGSSLGTTQYGFSIWYPTKYPTNVANAFVVASGIEAQLIRAEAALQAGDVDGWLTTLNTLRQTHPLTSSMPAIVDPGTFDTRVDTLFAERAAWLFLTGARQGDLRRLVNVYQRSSQTTYPSGEYPGVGLYGPNIDFPIPASELNNPYFKGCQRRD
jgi:hypothetical protein